MPRSRRGVCANFAARPVFHHGAPCVAAANGARRSLPMASTACVSPSASLRLPLPHGCQDIFTDTRSACLSGFQGSIPLPAQTAKGGSLKACPERSRTDPRRTWGWIASQRPFRTDAPLPFAIPKAPLHYALRLPPTCHDIFTHTNWVAASSEAWGWRTSLWHRWQEKSQGVEPFPNAKAFEAATRVGHLPCPFGRSGP